MGLLGCTQTSAGTPTTLREVPVQAGFAFRTSDTVALSWPGAEASRGVTVSLPDGRVVFDGYLPPDKAMPVAIPLAVDKLRLRTWDGVRYVVTVDGQQAVVGAP